MPNVNDMFPSAYVKAADLRGQNVDTTIATVSQVQVGEKLLWILGLVGHKKGLALNKTNAQTIAEAYGPETDGWIGKTIQMYPTKTTYAGRLTDCIRLRIIPQAQIAAPPLPAETELPDTVGVDSEGNEIPF